jgi:hypothetical protein
MKAGDENEVLDPKVIAADHFSGNAKASILIEVTGYNFLHPLDVIGSTIHALVKDM